MDVHIIKQVKGFTPMICNGQGDAQLKEAANVIGGDAIAGNCNKNAEEVAAADDDEEPEPESRTFAVPDPEFYDFDKDRSEECLAADQVWAIRDSLDAMPRLYALIKAIYTPFEVKIVWLDFVPSDQNEPDYETSGLPVACGKFEHGYTGTLGSICTFSHRVVCEKEGRITYKIYPRKGEIWALWNVTWNSDSENQRGEYEFVEVLSDYTEDMGVMVSYLVKVKGFVCMFKPVMINDCMDIIQIPSDELIRFSYMIPSFRTTGTEREDVPEGYFELDPASLPTSMLEEVTENVVVAGRVPALVPSSNRKPCEHPESEFHVFDVDKSHDKFQTGQIWALYGELDSFPKYYARINKVESYPKFKVHIQWLEAGASPKGVIQWLDNRMPTCCGIFSGGETMEFDETARFSHLAKGAVARTRNKYAIYPSEGEVWAIFREFSSELSSSDLQTCQYGVGQVDKVNPLNGTIKVLVLEKVPGYMTVFMIQRKAGCESILEIPRSELLRFSHQIPAFLLTDEKEGTLRGCWKLDPDAMPVSLSDLDTSIVCKETAISVRDATTKINSNGVGTNPGIAAEQRPLEPSHLDKYEIRKRSQKSKKRKISELNAMDGGSNSPTRITNIVYHRRQDGEASGRPLAKCNAATVSDGVNRCNGSTLGNKDTAAHTKEMSLDGGDTIPSSVNQQIQVPSPPAHLEMSKMPETEFCNFNEVGCSSISPVHHLGTIYSELSCEGSPARHLDKNMAANLSDGLASCDGSTFGSEDVAAAALSKEMSQDGFDAIPSSVNEQVQITSAPAQLKLSEIPETQFCNFNNERSPEMFKTGQIWAFFCKLDGLPKIYARVESVEVFPVLKLTVKWLDPCRPPKGVISWIDKGMPVCSGTFKVAYGEGVVFENSISFCHQLNAEPSGENLYTIYPRAGEVWALYSKFCSGLMCSNLKECEYYMVEILEVVDDRWIIVSLLQSVTGFKTVFKAKEREALDSIIAIPWVELYRLSHQVPSFMLKEARYGELRGCWELDPRSMRHEYSSN